MADIVTQLRQRAHRCPFAESPLVLDAADEIERLRALIAAIDEKHVPFDDEGDRGCHECVGLWWPCRTHLLIHPEEARRG